MSENQGSSAKEPGSGPGPGRRKTVRKGMFVKDRKYPRITKDKQNFAQSPCLIEHLFDNAIVKPMIYGAGDVPQPASDTVALMDDLIIDYITEMVSFLQHHFDATYFGLINIFVP